jgi:hypothetical protein
MLYLPSHPTPPLRHFFNCFLTPQSAPIGNMRYNGLHLKKQFWDIFADPNPTDLLFAPSWSEFAAGPNPMKQWDMTNPNFYAAGVHPDDPDRHTIWLDGYTSERSRTIEPSMSDGGRYYELFASCMRVYRLQATLGLVSNGLGCEVAGEDCCAVTEDEVFTRVYSLDAPSTATTAAAAAAAIASASTSASGSASISRSTSSNTSSSSSALPPGDTILTPDAGEVERLKAGGWRELCSATFSPTTGPSGLCFDGHLPWDNSTDGQYVALRGPFLLYANTSSQLPGSLPLVRCVTTAAGSGAASHFFVTSIGGCGAPPIVQELVVGYGMARPGGMTIRQLRQCTNGGFSYTVVDARCLDGSEGTKLLYVV